MFFFFPFPIALPHSRRKKGDHTAARNLFNAAQTLLIKTLGKDHSEVADVWKNMGLLEMELGNFPTAEALLKRAGTSFQKVGIVFGMQTS